MSAPNEHTSGIDEARKALAQARVGKRRTDRIVKSSAATTVVLNSIAAHPEPLIDSLRAIIRGAA